MSIKKAQNFHSTLSDLPISRLVGEPPLQVQSDNPTYKSIATELH